MTHPSFILTFCDSYLLNVDLKKDKTRIFKYPLIPVELQTYRFLSDCLSQLLLGIFLLMCFSHFRLSVHSLFHSLH